MNNIYEQIAKSYETMSKTQKKVADFILQDRLGASFLNVSKLASGAGVSEASIIRFANFLGLSGYSELQRLMQESARTQMGTKERLTMSYSAYEEEKGIVKIFEEEQQHIRSTLENLDTDMFFKIVDALKDAKRVFVVCGRSALGLGVFIDYYLKLMNDQVYIIEGFEHNEELISEIGSDDMVIALSFKRYTRKTVEMLEFLSKKQCKIASITDEMSSPLIKYSDFYLLAETRISAYLDSFVAPQALINALLIYVGKAKNRELEERFGKLEELWHDIGTFME